MSILSAKEFYDRIISAVGSTDEESLATLTIHAKDADEAKAAVLQLRIVKSELKLIKLEISGILALIRQQDPNGFRNLILSDLMEINFGERPLEGGLVEKKRTLSSLYRMPSAKIQELQIRIDQAIMRLRDYISRNP